MARQQWCVRCGEDRIEQMSTVIIDGDPLCNAHALMASAPPDPPDVAVSAEELERCPHGCGNPRHRGLCAGLRRSARTRHASLAAIAPKAAPPQLPAPARKALEKFEAEHEALVAPRRRGLMDTLMAEVVRDDEVPAESTPTRNIGRIGEIWLRLGQLKDGQTLKVCNRDRQHLRCTLKNLRESSKRRNRHLYIRAVDSFLYVRFLREGETA